MTEGKDSGTRGRPLHRPGGRRVHEHRRTRASVSPRAARAGRADGVGVASVPTVWGDRGLQVGQLPAPAVVFERAAAGAGAAAPVSWVWADVLGGVGAAGAWRVVRARGAAGRDRPLAAPGDLGAPDGGGAAVVAGASGTVAGVAAAGAGPGRRAGVPSECEHGRALGGSGGGDSHDRGR